MASMLPLFFVAAFRYYVGTDYGAYVRAFVQIGNGRSSSMEWLYQALSRIISRFGGNYVWIFVVSALVFLIPTFLHIFKYSPYPVLSIFLLFGMTYYFAFLNQMRQLMASAILMYSMRYIEDEKPLRFGLCVAIATGFHSTSWAFLILYFLRKLRLTPLKAAVIAVASWLLYNPLSTLLVRILQETEYSTYIGSDLMISRTRFLTQIAVILVASLWYDRSERYRQYYLSNYLAACAAAFGGTVSYAHRMIYTFGLSAVILLPMAINEVRTKQDRIIMTTVVVLCYSAYAFYFVVYRGVHEVLPYQFIFGHI